MRNQESRGWIVVGAIFVMMFFIWGAINSGGVFFLPVLKQFGWTRAKLSLAFSMGWLTAGAAGPLIGWLADRVNPKWLILMGSAITGLGWLALSQANSFAVFLGINGLFGICVSLATGIPSTLLIANWFQRRRGLAIGIAFSGSTLGGAAMTMVANYTLAVGGWRFGYASLSIPILLIVVPLVVFFIGSNPQSALLRDGTETNSRLRAVSPEVPGLEIREAVKTRSFWLISVVQLLSGLTFGMGPHYIAYLTGIGYTATLAASIASLYLVATTAGKLFGGPLADKFGARSAMFVTYLMAALGMMGLLRASYSYSLAVNILAGGFATGALSVQMPLVMIESLGLKRFGSLMGIVGIFSLSAAASSPVITGRIFDLTGSYRIAISIFSALLVLCSIALLGCRPLSRKEQPLALPTPSIAI